MFFIVGAVTAVAAETSETDQTKSGTLSEGRLSASVRLGVKFNPAAKESKAASDAAQPIFHAFSDPVSPGTVVLPPYLVEDARVKLTEKETLTAKGRLELAMKRHISPLYRTTFGPLAQLATYYFNWPSILGGWHPNEAEAMTLYRQEERLLMLDEMDSLVRLETLFDPKTARQFQRIRFGAEVTTR